MNKRATAWRRVMLFWTIFQAVGALAGGTMGMLADPSFYGGEAMVPLVQVATPFPDLFVPAAALFVLIGVGNLVAAILIVRRSRAGAYLGCAEGLVISAFTIAEIAILGMNPLSAVYCVLGVLQFVCGLAYVKALG